MDDSKATYEIMKNIVFVGFEILTNNKKPLINCSEEVLNSDVITILPKENIIIEILETVKANDNVIKRLSELKKKRIYLCN
jgi:EAL and modified HD-GYP domain-containing signal transduction protein